MESVSHPNRAANLPPEQQAIRDRCFHPTGTFVEFQKEEVEQSIPERFEKVVRMYPDRPAIKGNDQLWTYNELNQAANRLARTIHDSFGNETEPVVLLTEHTPAAVVACLGILKAGKVLVTVDASFPLERLNQVIDQAHASAIVTYNHTLSIAKRLITTCPILNVEDIAESSPDKNLGLKISPQAPANIRFTSGSTGTPKGVVRSHREILYGHLTTINTARICPSDCLLILRHLSFSTKDTFNGLLVGSAVCLYDVRENGFSKLADFIEEQAITYFVSTPSVFRYFISELNYGHRFPIVRTVQLGGEPLFKREAESFKKHFPIGCSLMNQFSSSETSTICQFVITGDTEITTTIVPVGYPIEGKKVYLIDEGGHEIQSEQVGEIVVKSRYLSSGYWGDSELSESKFFSDQTGTDERIYYTGDIGRMQTDGSFIYLGRKDDQVKIRGCKVQPSEVEACLSAHPTVRHAIVIPWDQDSGDKQLTAYVVPNQTAAPAISELKEFLREKLPEYMIPSSVLFLESLPLRHGKVDRQALPKPGNSRPALNQAYESPQNELERQLVLTWEEVLGVKPVGIHDNFFDLGGHSLAASRIISRILKTFELDLPIKALFDSPTVADMAMVITQNRANRASQEDLARLLSEVEALSEEEAQRVLAREQKERERR